MVSSRLKRLFPFLGWTAPSFDTIRRDAWAGITVGLVLVPQAIAYASLAGMPPETGLYAALLPSVIGVLWGSSSLLAVGPVALTSLLVFGSLSDLAKPGSAHWVALAIWLSIYAGVIQLVLGLFRCGRIANLVSQPVATGFINAAALIIIFSQLPALFGFAPTADSVQHLPAMLGQASVLATTAVGCAAVALLVALKRFAPKLPAMLIVAVAGIFLSWFYDFAALGVATIGKVPSGLPSLSLPPAISFDSHQQLWPAALIIALISFTEAMSSCRILARAKREQWDQDQELVGQGLAKFVGGLTGTFPVSGSFSRSALNLYAGAVSAWSTLFAVLCVLLTLLFLTDEIRYLPRSVVAAMIIVPVLGLLDFAAMRRFFRIATTEGSIALVTFIVTLMSAPRLHWGIFAGIGLTMAAFLYRRTSPRIVEVALHEDGTMRDRHRFGLDPVASDVLAVRIDAALNFLTAAALERFIMERTGERPDIRRVWLCAGSINDLDASGLDTLVTLKENLARDGVDFYVSALKMQVWNVIAQSGAAGRLDQERIFTTDAKALAALRSATGAA